ncbi:UDP-2,4-diacetamido-2,4,6-trideoxy-beta-L-altropyranose hydrolase [Stenotrophobium rhamnosiphilum]|uniref:UDP-2,4-diacetamido-2,4, 6-trideoxy-beta-L-altropyranose hydrolase n=1 Tax=Stenotrophobium rhamnosiphilum TaxID=2029166 RepID=A0A2T5MIG8_9GAMM|nr:UDP-2,4-diacetamido-2,4,6-trideoxy-beta-L-altropyranose hydrolase [Stenotrophobium rhamnosiphilum]PTU32371.1 UDP-2,4-diacetamido-2,4,6-trideoxy-beta-L-altropyranose hydrolase [Stenotrophobium rhamnosiphilum]
MRIAIRVDASVSIGTGHVVRCATLAKALLKQDQGVELSFICRELPGDLVNWLRTQGFVVHALPTPNDVAESWNSIPEQIDANQTADVLKKAGYELDWLIVDHYGLSATWEQALRISAGQIMVIDDLADRKHDADILLDQNFFQTIERRYQGLLPAKCRQLLGPRYALLRDEFSALRKLEKSVCKGARKIVISFGGSDASNETTKALDALNLVGLEDIEVDVIVGASNLHRDQIASRCAADVRMRFHCQTDQIANIFWNADLSIGAGGTTTWERSALRLPSIVISIAENQEKISEDLAKTGAILYLGRSQDVTVETLSHIISTALHCPELLYALSDHSGRIVDGKGAKRVALHMLGEGISLRRATAADALATYEWRNSPEVRRYSGNGQEIQRVDHERWFLALLSDPNRALLIGEIDGRAIGVLRFDDLMSTETTVSIYLVPTELSKGYGPLLLRAGQRWLTAEYPKLRWIIAKIHVDNTPSVAAFTEAGYSEYQYEYRCEL